MRYSLLILVVLLSVELNRAEIADILASGIFGPKKADLISCYSCYNISDVGCNDVYPNSTDLIQTCEEGTKGCLKRLYFDGKDTVLSRMCYKGPTKLINDYKCTGLQYNYAIQKCYICSGNLCNGSNSMFANRSFVYGIFLVFCTLLCQFL
ncbi:uncharacterized protein LOC105261462 [Musca domestica]|uniref:Uncharacterized protein LOC105261462 n=1 Tax=Musca domestica TaxID=7370 RepID=A0A9J7D319_MUSDO|nr:uncharacterized protein LOC105261462 [Musca domestica]